MLFVKKQLKQSFLKIEQVIKKDPFGNPWLWDNFYLIHRGYTACLKNKTALKQKRVFCLILSALERFREDFDEEKLTETLLLELDEPNFFELDSLSSLLPACIISFLGKKLSENNPREIPWAVRLLISCGGFDFEKILSDCWAPEKILSKNEPDFLIFDSETKYTYRFGLAKMAKKAGKSETEYAKELLSLAKQQKQLMGELIFAGGGKEKFLWLSITVLLTAALLSVWNGSWRMMLLLSVPVWWGAGSAADIVCARIFPPKKAFRLDPLKLPKDIVTLTARASLIASKQDITESFCALERFFYMNTDSNHCFCLLADLTDSAVRYKQEDVELTELAKQEVDRLNRLHGDRFCLFFRDRSRLESEGCFGGWERKRGAVCQLIDCIRGKSKNDFYGCEMAKKAGYLLTLDGDTNLSVGSINELLAVALHPLNRPKIKNGRVQKGYGIIQPSVKTSLSSCYKTLFSRLTTGAGGREVYATASYDRDKMLFGTGCFCGKGLINVELFGKIVCNRFPNNLILSHDIPEGLMLRTLSATDILLTDSTPKNSVSYFKRLHRWCRGDFQNLWFLFHKTLSAGAKMRLLLTASRHFVPVFSVVSLFAFCLWGSGSGLAAVALGLSNLLLPFFAGTVRELFAFRHGGVLRFFSKTLAGVFQSASLLLFDLISLSKRAWLTVCTFFLAIYRLFTKQKTLRWTASAQVDALSTGLGKYVLDGWNSVLFGGLLVWVSASPFTAIVGILWFVYPLVGLFLARPIPRGGAVAKVELTKKQKQLLLSHASDMWGFYRDNVGQSTMYLPPDNIQLSPVEEVAMRTSPTNIGFYLVSVLAAGDMNIISADEMCAMIKNTLDTVESLEKWKGNLFNWYDLTDGSVIGDRFVSSVDSGNFVVMLIALAEGLEEYSSEIPLAEELSKKCRSIAGSTDISAFFDSKKMLFSIGYSEKEGRLEQNCYDMLMSEARMTGYYAVAAAKVPKNHWQKLGRTLTVSDGHLGMLSWSGTAFEYLLPQLFLPLFNDSFFYESIKFALMLQEKQSPVWGVSESGFYAFDSNMRYRYKAHGTRGLALRRVGDDEQVVSPYSTYLSLCVCGAPAIKNLQNLTKLGMYGKYGLYEAIDFSQTDQKGLRVRSYMAHHVGMSMVACTNALMDRVFVRRFMRDNRMGSAAELLQEKVPTDAHVFETEKTRNGGLSKKIVQKPDQTKKSSARGITVLSGDGPLSALVSERGQVCLRRSDVLLTNTVFDARDERFSLFVTFSEKGKCFGCAPLYGNGNFSFERDGYSAAHINASGDFSGRVRYSISQDGSCFLILANAENSRVYDLTLAFEPVMERDRDFYSHISFSRLFVESEYDNREKILFFGRRSKKDGSKTEYLAVALEEGRDFSFRTSKNGLDAFSLNAPQDFAFLPADGATGACLNPMCLVRAEGSKGGKECFFVAVGKTKSECVTAIKNARKTKKELPVPKKPASDALASGFLLSEPKKQHREHSFGLGDLWGLGISADYPLALFELSKSNTAAVMSLLEGFLCLRRAGIVCELVLMTREDEEYERPLEKELEQLCLRAGVREFLFKNGGIFLIRSEGLADSAKKALFYAAAMVSDLDRDTLDSLIPDAKPILLPVITKQNRVLPILKKEGVIQTDNGYFKNNGYTVEKQRQNPETPFSYLLAGRRFGSVVTHCGLGYTFFDNARESRLCSFFGDPSSIDSGERILLVFDGAEYDLCACSDRVDFCDGIAEYHGTVEHCSYTLRVCVSEKFPVKLLRVFLSDPALDCVFRVRPSMGDTSFFNKRAGKKPVFFNGTSAILFSDPVSASFSRGVGFLGVCGGVADENDCSVSARGNELLFFLGCCTSNRGAEKMVSQMGEEFFDREEAAARRFALSHCPPITIKTKSVSRDLLQNFWLPYQIAASRFFGRGSFYQSGGAYGFRDQLQDCLSLVYSHSDLVKVHIFRCCAHQYEEGNVMHWWHTKNHDGVNRGTKTKCSDDLLWLPITVADYLKKTGDTALLTKEIFYITSPPLGTESERYEQPQKSRVRESVYRHCIRALSYADRRGERGLVLMGSCDWNDAFSLVGEKGKGESVFSAMLLVYACSRFLPVMEMMGDTESAQHFLQVMEELKQSIETHAFFGDRYARMFCDDGTVFGVDGSRECSIDAICQGFGALAELDKSRVSLALKTAYTRLFDPKNRIFRLFDPPFTDGKERVGYVRGYVAGIRENGGQYTHGALFAVSGMLKIGMTEEALTVLSSMDPISRSVTPQLKEKLKTEPYVLTADIYAGQHSGRGGWSWYTGAASWMYRVFTEQVLGLELTDGFSAVNLSPVIPFEATLRFGDWELFVKVSEKETEVLFDGASATLPVKPKKGKHTLTMPPV